MEADEPHLQHWLESVEKESVMSNAIMGGRWRGCMVYFALGLVLPVSVASGLEPPTLGGKVGQMHRDFLLPKVGGGWGRLSDFREKKTVLIHFASW